MFKIQIPNVFCWEAKAMAQSQEMDEKLAVIGKHLVNVFTIIVWVFAVPYAVTIIAFCAVTKALCPNMGKRTFNHIVIYGAAITDLYLIYQLSVFLEGVR